MITIFGASDDLIEIEDDNGPGEEFCSYDGGYLGFSTGLLVKIEYTGLGEWKITPVRGDIDGPGRKLIRCKSTDDDYSDVLVLDEQIDWIMFAGESRNIFLKR